MIFLKAHCLRLCCISLVYILLSFANTNGQILVGVKGGLQYSWVNFQNDVDKDFLSVSPVLGYNAGLVFAFKVQKRFFLQTEFLYSVKGRKFEGELDDELESIARLNFIEAPLIYRMDFQGFTSNGQAFKWYLGAGPIISYWLSGGGTLSSSQLLESEIDQIDFDYVFGDIPADSPLNELYVENPNRFQLGLTFAAGIMLEATERSSFVIDLRYEFGHSFLAQDDIGVIPQLVGYADPLEVRNAGFRLSLTYLFDTKYEERKKGKSTYKKK